MSLGCVGWLKHSFVCQHSLAHLRAGRCCRTRLNPWPPPLPCPSIALRRPLSLCRAQSKSTELQHRAARRARFWARRLAERGLVGVVLSQSPEYVAPHGSSQALFGTNPIAVRRTSCMHPGRPPRLVLRNKLSALAEHNLTRIP